MYYRHPAVAITTTSNGTERSTAPQLLLLLRQSVERRRALISIQIPRNFPTTTTVESSPRGLYPEFLGSLQILPGSTFLLLSPNILLLAHAHCTLWIRKYRFYVYAARAYTLRFVPARSLSLSLFLPPLRGQNLRPLPPLFNSISCERELRHTRFLPKSVSESYHSGSNPFRHASIF